MKEVKLIEDIARRLTSGAFESEKRYDNIFGGLDISKEQIKAFEELFKSVGFSLSYSCEADIAARTEVNVSFIQKCPTCNHNL